MLIAPADHAIPETQAFRQAVDAAILAAEAGSIVTFGFIPLLPQNPNFFMGYDAEIV